MNRVLKKAEKKICKSFPSVMVEEKDGNLRFFGTLDTLNDLSKVSLAVAKLGAKGVINDIVVKNMEESLPKARSHSSDLDGASPSVLVIGAGLLGCTIARELSRYNVRVMVVDKKDDVGDAQTSFACGNVKANFSLKAGSREWYYSARGYQTFSRLVEELNVPFNKCGQLVLFNSPLQLFGAISILLKAKKQEIRTGKFLTKKAILKLEPNAPEKVKFGVYFPSSGVVDTVALNCALAENLIANGVKVELNTLVESMTVERGWIKEVKTCRGVISPQIVINAAGAYADKISGMAKDRDFSLYSSKYNRIVVDSSLSPVRICEKRSFFKKDNLIFSPAIDGKLSVYERVPVSLERESKATDDSIDELISKVACVIDGIEKENVVDYYSGTVQSPLDNRLILRRGKQTKNIIEVVDVEACGVTALPQIAVDVSEIAIGMLDGAKENFSFEKTRKAPLRISELNVEGIDEAVRLDPKYGEIVCRCNMISKGELVELIDRDKLTTVSAVKKRLGLGHGECKGEYCSAKLIAILAEYWNVPLEKIMNSTPDGEILFDVRGEEK